MSLHYMLKSKPHKLCFHIYVVQTATAESAVTVRF